MTIQERIAGLFSSLQKNDVILAGKLMSTLTDEEQVNVFETICNDKFLVRSNPFLACSVLPKRLDVDFSSGNGEWNVVRLGTYSIVFIEHSRAYLMHTDVFSPYMNGFPDIKKGEIII